MHGGIGTQLASVNEIANFSKPIRVNHDPKSVA